MPNGTTQLKNLLHDTVFEAISSQLEKELNLEPQSLIIFNNRNTFSNTVNLQEGPLTKGDVLDLIPFETVPLYVELSGQFIS